MSKVEDVELTEALVKLPGKAEEGVGNLRHFEPPDTRRARMVANRVGVPI